jgi:hypothetical protein
LTPAGGQGKADHPLPAGAAMTIFFTSDSHFAHPRLTPIDRPPFA